MANPVLNERAFEESRVGWAAPTASSRYVTGTTTSDVMTVSGTMLATGVLFAILLVTGVVGWMTVSVDSTGQTNFPSWIFVPLIAAFGIAIFSRRKPQQSVIYGPLYAALEGIVIGAISHAFNIQYNGIVVMAVGATAAVFASMLFLYSTRIIKVTDKMRRAVTAATMGVFLLYGVSLIMSLFGSTPSFLDSSGGLGILLSVVIIGIAAFNLMLSFDLIERGAASGAPKYMEWYAAFGLMVTIVWLYLEMLRLLAKLQNRR
jgi:uncharacterized YccA/Bax inhibitor family protein